MNLLSEPGSKAGQGPAKVFRKRRPSLSPLARNCCSPCLNMRQIEPDPVPPDPVGPERLDSTAVGSKVITSSQRGISQDRPRDRRLALICLQTLDSVW